MHITFDEQNRFFHLSTSEMSYAFGIAADGRLRHLYWGPALSSDASLLPRIYPVAEAMARIAIVDALMQFKGFRAMEELDEKYDRM